MTLRSVRRFAARTTCLSFEVDEQALFQEYFKPVIPLAGVDAVMLDHIIPRFNSYFQCAQTRVLPVVLYATVIRQRV